MKLLLPQWRSFKVLQDCFQQLYLRSQKSDEGDLVQRLRGMFPATLLALAEAIRRRSGSKASRNVFSNCTCFSRTAMTTTSFKGFQECFQQLEVAEAKWKRSRSEASRNVPSNYTWSRRSEMKAISLTGFQEYFQQQYLRSQ